MSPVRKKYKVVCGFALIALALIGVVSFILWDDIDIYLQVRRIGNGELPKVSKRNAETHEILNTLSSKITLSFQDTPFPEVLMTFQILSQLNLTIDQRASADLQKVKVQRIHFQNDYLGGALQKLIDSPTNQIENKTFEVKIENRILEIQEAPITDTALKISAIPIDDLLNRKSEIQPAGVSQEVVIQQKMLPALIRVLSGGEKNWSAGETLTANSEILITYCDALTLKKVQSALEMLREGLSK